MSIKTRDVFLLDYHFSWSWNVVCNDSAFMSRLQACDGMHLSDYHWSDACSFNHVCNVWDLHSFIYLIMYLFLGSTVYEALAFFFSLSFFFEGGGLFIIYKGQEHLRLYPQIYLFILGSLSFYSDSPVMSIILQRKNFEMATTFYSWHVIISWTLLMANRSRLYVTKRAWSIMHVQNQKQKISI